LTLISYSQELCGFIHRIAEPDSELSSSSSSDDGSDVPSHTLTGMLKDDAGSASVPPRRHDWRTNHFCRCTRSASPGHHGEYAGKERKGLLPHRLFKDPLVYAITFNTVKFHGR